VPLGAAGRREAGQGHVVLLCWYRLLIGSLAPLGRGVHIKAGFPDQRPNSGSTNTCVIWRGLSSRSGRSQLQQLQAIPGEEPVHGLLI